MSSADASSRCAAISRALSRSLREMTAVAAPATGVERLAYVPRPYGVLSVSPSCTSTSSYGMPSSSATIWANVVSWPCPCDLTPSLRIALPVGCTRSSAESNISQAGDVVLLAGPAPTTSVKRRDPDADQPALLPRLAPAPRAAPRSRASRARCASPRVVAGVVDEAGRRLVRELLGLDEVRRAGTRPGRRRARRPPSATSRSIRYEASVTRNEQRYATPPGALFVYAPSRDDVRGRDVVAAGDDVEQPGAELRGLRVGVERALVGEQRRRCRPVIFPSLSASSPLHVVVAREPGRDQVPGAVLDPLHRAGRSAARRPSRRRSPGRSAPCCRSRRRGRG